MRIRYLLMNIGAFCVIAAACLPAAQAMGTRPQSAAGLGTGQIVATAGIRGLDEEKLKAAQYDAAQVNELESQTVSADVARSFAALAGLHSRPIAYLPDPAHGNGIYP